MPAYIGTRLALLRADVAAGGAIITKTADPVDVSAQTTYTFSTQPIGAAATGRRIIVGFGCARVGAVTIDSMTIGGSAAAEVVEVSDNDGTVFYASALYILQVDAGTTATIAVTISASAAAGYCEIWSAYGLSSSTAVDTLSSTASPPSGGLDVSAGGIAVGYCNADSGGGGLTFTWAGLTEDLDETVSGTTSHTGASQAFAAGELNRTITCTPSAGTAAAMVAASFL